MHDAALQYIKGEWQHVADTDGLVVEIGSRNINGSARELFNGRTYVGVDIVPGDGVDEVCDGAVYQPREPAAVVICMETLEHTPAAADICANAFHMLKPRGVFLVTAAGDGRAPHSSVDGGALRLGEYYANVSADHLRQWLSAFAEVRVQLNPTAGDIYATAIKGLS